MGDLSKREQRYLCPIFIIPSDAGRGSVRLSLSQVVHESVGSALSEDEVNPAAFEERSAEATVTLDELLEDLRAKLRLQAPHRESIANDLRRI